MCPGKYAVTCTGTAAPSDAPCDLPSVGADGAKTYCCGGCEAMTDSACPTSVANASSERCRGGARPALLPYSACLAGDASGDGTIPYCCLKAPLDGQPGSPRTAPNLTCTSGSPVESYSSEPNASLHCSAGRLLSGTYHDGYCCASGACNATTVTCAIGALNGTTYRCGAAYPSAQDASVVCAQGYEQDDANTLGADFSFCCATLPAGNCKADPAVPGCIDPGLLGLSCTGTSTPRDQLPSLHCLAGTPGADGTTKYCCGG